MNEEFKRGRDYESISHLIYWQDTQIDSQTYMILRDFKNFLWLTFKYLGLPSPTPIQYDVADYLQGNRQYDNLSIVDTPVEDLTGDDNGAGAIVCAFRGFGKSWITAIYCVWVLLRLPHLEITVVSATETKSTAFMGFALSVIKLIPFCSHLIPQKNSTNNKFQLDTPQHKPSQSNSLCACAIFSSMLTGRRSDIIIGDDLEVPNNSRSLLLRDRLAERVTEFEAVLGDIPVDGKVKFKQKLLLGTPQTQETLYMRLVKKNGYEMRIWPARFPNDSQNKRIGHLLCPKIKSKIDKDEVETTGFGIRSDMGQRTDTRFTDSDLLKKEKGYGYTGFQLQYQLDPSLSDMAKFPLKLSDLIVADVNSSLGYNMMVWSSDKYDILNELPNYGFVGDYFKKPSSIDTTMVKYEDSVLCIDPSSGGSGSDETTYCVAKTVNGFIYIFEIGGFIDGPQSQKTMDDIAAIAKKHQVNSIVVESNQGLGMFETLLRPALIRAKYVVEVEGFRAIGQKEKRIINTLEPVMNSHRLIFDRSLVANEELPDIDGMSDDMRIQYSLFYQMTHLELLKDCLPKDDRVDVLQIAVQHFRESIERDSENEVMKREIDLVERYVNCPSILDNVHNKTLSRIVMDGQNYDLEDYFSDDNNYGGCNMLDID